MLVWTIVTIAILAAAFPSGRFTAKYAAARGRSERTWFVLGALFFPFFPVPWMVLALLPKK